ASHDELAQAEPGGKPGQAAQPAGVGGEPGLDVRGLEEAAPLPATGRQDREDRHREAARAGKDGDPGEKLLRAAVAAPDIRGMKVALAAPVRKRQVPGAARPDAIEKAAELV